MKGVDLSGLERGTGSEERVGRYRLLQVLGEGGMGVVHLAQDTDGRRVAIKVLRPEVASDGTAVRRLAREVDTMRRVRSPNVAEILDADVTAERPYIVTQFVPGLTLEEVVTNNGPLGGRPLQRLAAGLANALAAIHGAGIIHRDLKPGNVMLPGVPGRGGPPDPGVPEGEPVLIDFGIAQGLDATRLTATGLVIGTPGYLAPEIIEGEEAGPPSDIHAWAGTLAFAATGRPPFGSGTFESIFYKIMQNTPDLSGAPEPILPLIRAAMARHPAERPTAVKLVQLARRIDLDLTMTDQTRMDRPLSEFGLAAPAKTAGSGKSAGPGAPGQSAGPAKSAQSSEPRPTTADGALGLAAAAGAGAVAGAVAAEGLAHESASGASRAPGGATSGPVAPGAGRGVTDETMADYVGGGTGTSQSAASPQAPAPSRSGRNGLQQPKDFVGMLPPAAPPPPAPPRQSQRPSAQPYVPPPADRSAYAGTPPTGYQPYTAQPAAYPPPGHQGYPPPGYQPQGHPPPGHDPYGPGPHGQGPLGTVPDQRAPDGYQPGARGEPGGRGEEEKKRKPYFLYRLCSLATLGVLLGLAAFTPVIMLGVALVLAILLRAADKAAKGMESKRTRRGPGAGDVIGAMVKTPLHVPGAVLKTAMWGGLHLFAGVALVVVLMISHPDLALSKAVAYGVMAIIAVHFLGPGSSGPRRQAARIWATFLPVAGVAAVGLLGLAALAAVLVGTSLHRDPSLSPVHVSGTTKTLNDLKHNLHSKIGIG